MNTRTRVILVVALLGIIAAVLAVAFVQRGGAPVPATTVQPATDRAATEDTATLSGETAAPVTPLDGATVEPGTSTTPAPTPTPTEGEKAAAAVGQEFSNYSPTRTECEQAFESGEVEACVWPDSIQLIVRPEWEQLVPDTSFYVIGLTGRYQEPEYDYYRRTRLVAWHDGQRYTAETFDRLLKANGVITITDENRELVAKALVLMTLADYLGEDIVFSDWRQVTDGPRAIAGLRYNYAITVWTKIEGLSIRWWFLFVDGDLRQAGGGIVERRTGDYIRLLPPETAPAYPNTTYTFWGN